MKKNITLSLVVISLLTFILGFAASTPPETKNVSLATIRYAQNSVIIQFTLTGFNKLSEIEGSVIVNEDFTQLKCRAVQGNGKNIKVIKCMAESMNRYSGQNARIWLSGFVFYTKIPLK